MFKKLFAFIIISTLAFTACSSDNSTEPFQESALTLSSSSILSSSANQNLKGDLSSSSVVMDTVRYIKNDTLPVKDSLLKANVTCEVLVDTDTSFKVKIVVPDSATMTFNASFRNYIYEMIQTVEFRPDLPQSSLDAECANAKADAAEIKEELRLVDAIGDITVTCEGNVITQNSYTLSESKLNPMPLIAADYFSDCEEIQKTGVLPPDFDE